MLHILHLYISFHDFYLYEEQMVKHRRSCVLNKVKLYIEWGKAFDITENSTKCN